MQGATFATYAVQRIRGAMLDELRGRDWAPRCAPSGAGNNKAVRALEQSLGRAAAEQEIADSLQMDIAEYRQVLTDTNNSQLFSYDEWHEIHGESCEPVRDDDDGGNPLGLLVDESLRHRWLRR